MSINLCWKKYYPTILGRWKLRLFFLSLGKTEKGFTTHFIWEYLNLFHFWVCQLTDKNFNENICITICRRYFGNYNFPNDSAKIRWWKQKTYKMLLMGIYCRWFPKNQNKFSTKEKFWSQPHQYSYLLSQSNCLKKLKKITNSEYFMMSSNKLYKNYHQVSLLKKDFSSKEFKCLKIFKILISSVLQSYRYSSYSRNISTCQ